MIKNDLKKWLHEEAQNLTCEYCDADLKTLPEGWQQPKCVEHYGGEDQGSEYWTIWNFTHADGTSVLIRVNSWYQSYNGPDYQDFAEVTPVSKTIIVYEEVK